MGLEVEFDQMFSDELADDVVVIRGDSRGVIRAIVDPVGQEIVTGDGLVVGKRPIDLLVLKDTYHIGKKLEIPQQNDEFELPDGTRLELAVGPDMGTFEWEVLNLVYRITTIVQ